LARAAPHIYFVCWVEHPDLHTARSGTVIRDQVTIHEGRWAYCSSGGKYDHRWEPIEPVDMGTVKMYERHRREPSG
jgi:hypothetical protein